MRQLGLFRKEVRLNFLKHHKIYLTLSTLLLIASVVIVFYKGFNLGVDFKGGYLVEIKPKTANYSMADIRKSVEGYDVEIQEFKSDNTIQMLFSKKSLSSLSKDTNYLKSIKGILGDNYDYLRSEYVGANVSKDLIRSSVISIILSLIGIMLYVWYRFDWQYGVTGIISLIHDVIVSCGIMAFFGYEFNINTIAAILTIVGFSIHDTVVTFNQIRENLKRYSKESDITIINYSLSDVLSRSLATSLTVLLVLLAIFLVGGETLRSFSFTLLVGVFFGTYSSLFIATPLLLYIGKLKRNPKIKKA